MSLFASGTTPRLPDSEWNLIVKQLEATVAAGSAASVTGGDGPPAFTPSGVSLAIYKDRLTGINYFWDATNGWQPPP